MKKLMTFGTVLILAACANPNKNIVAFNKAMGKLAVQNVAAPINAAGLKGKYKGFTYNDIYNQQNFYNTYGGQNLASQLYTQGYSQNINNPLNTCQNQIAQTQAGTFSSADDLSNKILATVSCLYTMYSYSPGMQATSGFFDQNTGTAVSYGSLGAAFGAPMPFTTYFNGTTGIMMNGQIQNQYYSPVYGQQMSGNLFPYQTYAGVNYY